jgi:hypothetical protein
MSSAHGLRPHAIPPTEVPPVPDYDRGTADPGLWRSWWRELLLPPPPTVSILAAGVVSAAVLVAQVRRHDASFAVAGALGRLWPLAVFGLPVAITAALSAVLLNGRSWRARPLSALVVAAATLLTLGIAAWRGWQGDAPVAAVIAAWVAAWVAVLVRPRRSFRSERAWLLARPDYGRTLAGLALVALGIPFAAGLALQKWSEGLDGRYRAITGILRGPAESCLADLARVSPTGSDDRLAIAAFAGDGLMGRDLSACVLPALHAEPSLSARLEFSKDQICRGPEAGVNAGPVAAWFERRGRLLRVRGLAEALGQRDREAYLAAIEGRAGEVCDNPFLVPEADLIRSAAPRGALERCASPFDPQHLSTDEWVRRGLAHVREIGQPAVFEATAFPGRRVEFAERMQEAPGPAGFQRVSVASAVLLRPLADRDGFEIGLHVRWVPPAAVARMYPSLRQTGAEIYLVECRRVQDADALLRALRDEWKLAALRPMGTPDCRAAAGPGGRRVLWFPSGAPYLVAERHTGEGFRTTRLAYTRDDPCQR